jgi:hypothetical protein
MKSGTLLSLASLITLSITPAALAVQFDLRGAAGAALDGMSSGSVLEGGITATVSSQIPGLLNQISGGFGINASGSGDETHLLDDGSGVTESIGISFDVDVLFTGLALSLFSAGEEGSLLIPGQSPLSLLDTGAGDDIYTFASNNFVPAGQSVILSHVSGNGFSFDSFTVERAAVPVGGSTLPLLLAPLLGLVVMHGKARGLRVGS